MKRYSWADIVLFVAAILTAVLLGGAVVWMLDALQAVDWTA